MRYVTILGASLAVLLSQLSLSHGMERQICKQQCTSKEKCQKPPCTTLKCQECDAFKGGETTAPLEENKYDKLILKYFTTSMVKKLNNTEKEELGTSLTAIDKLKGLHPKKIKEINEHLTTIMDIAMKKGVGVHELSSIVNQVIGSYNQLFMGLFEDDYTLFHKGLEEKHTSLKENIKTKFDKKLAAYFGYLKGQFESKESMCPIAQILGISLMLAQYIDEQNGDKEFSETQELFQMMEVNNILPGIGDVEESIYSCSTGQRVNLFLLHARIIIEKAVILKMKSREKEKKVIN
jgi:hypothetical protein